MEHQDKKGRFVPGNKAYKARGPRKPKPFQEIKNTCKDEIMQCALSLTFPVGTVKNETANQEISRLQYLTNQAVLKNNTKFIHWLVEMAVGRPPSGDIVVDKDLKPFVIETLDGGKIVLGVKSEERN